MNEVNWKGDIFLSWYKIMGPTNFRTNTSGKVI